MNHPAVEPARMLALGDSYTVGESVPESSSWPMQLAARLREKGLDFGEVKIIAQTGWTTAELQTAINSAKITPPFDYVSLMIGVNNQYRSEDLRRYRNEFNTLLLHAVAFANRCKDRVLVLSIPDWSVTPFAKQDKRSTKHIAKEIDAFNAEAKSICRKRGVQFIDITSVSRDRGGEPDMLTTDGLHPSPAMYARWVEIIIQQHFSG